MDIQATLNREFSRSNFEVQLITGFKEITMILGETPWELDQRLKCMIHEANMKLTGGQHREWFVTMLTSHLTSVLSQEKLTTQVEP